MATRTLQRKGKKTKGQFSAIPHQKGSDVVLDAVADNLEQLTGMRGLGNKKAVLWEDMADLGLADFSSGRLRKSLDLSRLGGNGGNNPGGNVTVNGDPVERPTTPQNVVARSGFNLATITWDTPTYKGHAYAKVFQSLDDNFSNATVVATTPSSIFSTPIEPNKDYYYWVKFVNIIGQESPINAIHGAHARAVVDPQFYLDMIAKEVANNPNFIPVPDALGGLDISGLPDAQQIADLDKLLAEAIIQNAATVDKQVRELKVGERTLRATIERDYYTIVKTDEAIAGAATRLKSEIESPQGNIMSALNQNFVTKTGLNKAISSMSNSLGTRIGENEARLTTLAQTVGDDSEMRAMWSVKADIGDLHASVGLIAKSAADMSHASAQFVVRNSDFRVVYDSDGDGSNPSEVATVFGTIVNPAYTDWVQAGKHGPAPTKYILAINTASIKVANIKDLVAGEIVADKVLAQSLIESPRLRTPVINEPGANFYVNAAGNVDMNLFTARAGTLRDRLSMVGGSYIDGRANQHFLNSRNNKFYVTHDGYLYAEDGVFRGTIYADHIIGDLVSGVTFRITDPIRGSRGWHKMGYFTVTNNNAETATLNIHSLTINCSGSIRGDFGGSDGSITWRAQIRSGSQTLASSSVESARYHVGHNQTRNLYGTLFTPTYFERLGPGETRTYSLWFSGQDGSAASPVCGVSLFRNGSAFSNMS
ncbi:TPA: hypothetical protein P0E30_003772 [Vibrio harveyi]|nr:hypothetical protein [Vibrio harveyi]